MPKCNCGGRGCQGCNCIITEGSGVTIEGTGRGSDPYVISADGGSSGGFQSGDLKWTARSSAPAGWLICDGTAVSRDVYDTLFAAIGETYGPGDGGTTFNLPDFQGRFAMGEDTDHPAGSSGGDTGVTLSVANLPAHQHSINHEHASDGVHDHRLDRSTTTGSHTATIPYGKLGIDTTNRDATRNDGAHTHGAFTGSSGSKGAGTPVPFTPPYVAVLCVIKS